MVSNVFRLKKLNETDQPLTYNTDTYWPSLTTYWHLLTLTYTYWLRMTLRTSFWVLILWTWANDYLLLKKAKPISARILRALKISFWVSILWTWANDQTLTYYYYYWKAKPISARILRALNMYLWSYGRLIIVFSSVANGYEWTFIFWIHA